MSLPSAIKIVSDELPPGLAQEILNSLPSGSEECSGSGYSFWKCKRPHDQSKVMQVRLKHAEDSDLRSWLGCQIDLIRKSESIYQGYCKVGDLRHEFMISTDLKTYAKYSTNI